MALHPTDMFSGFLGFICTKTIKPEAGRVKRIKKRALIHQFNSNFTHKYRRAAQRQPSNEIKISNGLKFFQNSNWHSLSDRVSF